MVIELDLIRLTGALGLIAIAIGISLWERLGLAQELAIATVRTVVQLIAVGYVLAVVFAWRDPIAILAVVAIMLAVAALVTRNRISKTTPRLLLIIWSALLVSVVLVLGYTNLVVLQPATWYDPQYFIPLASIVLGNAMTSAAIAGERLAHTLKTHRLEIETHLCLGATPAQAIGQYRREAIRAGLIPTLNTMMVVGIVKLPGVITGQIMSGVDPLNAAYYQILIMLMLACADVLTAVFVTQGLYRQYFNAAAQLIEPQ